jgi:hypothetical protein
MKKPFEGGAYGWKPDVDYRLRPDLYRVGKGEQGVLICEPYKSELLPYWRFRPPEIATESSGILYDMFLAYLADDDFPGADMARKYLQMGFTRARRYANYKGGRKYADDGGQFERGTGDPLKARSAEIFYRAWQDAEANPAYARRKADWKKRYG